MKVVQINATCGVGSTGKICVEIAKLLDKRGDECRVVFASGETRYSGGVKYSNDREVKIAALKSRVFGNWGFNSTAATRRTIALLEEFKPEIVHLHNLHGHNVDLETLFRYFRQKKTKLIWTFHDCWAFTGYCPYFTMVGCQKWRTKCGACPQKRDSTWFFDRSGAIFERKKRLFAGLDLTIVTPSQWLADLTRESFLKDYPVKVINNGIDLDVFQPTESDFRRKRKLEGKFVVLGVAFGWGARKGLDVFVELAKRLDDRYRIVLVGTDAAAENILPENVISIRRTLNQRELAEIYTAADVFANPTREENYPTVNMESLACGTPIVTFRTGGSPEILDATCGSVVDCDDVDATEREIRRVCEEKTYSTEACLKRAAGFDAKAKFKEYIDLYESCASFSERAL